MPTTYPTPPEQPYLDDTPFYSYGGGGTPCEGKCCCKCHAFRGVGYWDAYEIQHGITGTVPTATFDSSPAPAGSYVLTPTTDQWDAFRYLTTIPIYRRLYVDRPFPSSNWPSTFVSWPTIGFNIDEWSSNCWYQGSHAFNYVGGRHEITIRTSLEVLGDNLVNTPLSPAFDPFPDQSSWTVLNNLLTINFLYFVSSGLGGTWYEYDVQYSVATFDPRLGSTFSGKTVNVNTFPSGSPWGADPFPSTVTVAPLSGATWIQCGQNSDGTTFEAVSEFSPMMASANQSRRPLRTVRCLHLGRRLETTGCCDRDRRHACDRGHDAIPAASCQVCPSYEPDGNAGW